MTSFVSLVSSVSEAPRRRWQLDWGALVRRRIPIIDWLPKYTVSKGLQDTLAGITVGLTEIPQGIAYAVVAGI